ncbi:putative clathrin assembly protein At5g35200 isoform X1 [Typha latifolia]|uniref:putative clathrin assembly protein At5g35200 isoform X1 n=1 Tax=Typha latifolia TaxID=4733 RepID=UPI003C2B92A1
MAVGGSTQQSIRKALGALKDSTTVGLAKVNSYYKELDVAIVKATNHVEQLSKEKHICTIFDAVSASRPRADVTYCTNALAKRLTRTHNWAVALKTLIVIHRGLREVDPTFHEEIINYSRTRGSMLNLSHFKDDSSPSAWDYSAWVRTYALFLEERLECFRILKYDIMKEQSRIAEVDTVDLLEQLPALQQLLFRLLGCQPEGATMYNNIIRHALSIVASESIKIYSAINAGILNLVEKFFEMQRHDALRALEIYRKAGHQAERLSDFYEICKGLNLGRMENIVKIEQPPASFVAAMEEYVKDAPRALSSNQIVVESDRHIAPRAILAIENQKVNDDPENIEAALAPQPTSPVLLVLETSEASVQHLAQTPVTDLLRLDFDQSATEMEEKNALALDIIADDNLVNGTQMPNLTTGSTGWELELVGASSSNQSALAESKLAGGLDKLTLDSLYDDAMARRSNPNRGYHMGQVAPNPFEVVQYSQDPFSASNSIAPTSSVQMAATMQQQALMMQQQQQQQAMGQGSTNPFGNPYNPYTGYT